MKNCKIRFWGFDRFLGIQGFLSVSDSNRSLFLYCLSIYFQAWECVHLVFSPLRFINKTLFPATKSCQPILTLTLGFKCKYRSTSRLFTFSYKRYQYSGIICSDSFLFEIITKLTQERKNHLFLQYGLTFGTISENPANYRASIIVNHHIAVLFKMAPNPPFSAPKKWWHTDMKEKEGIKSPLKCWHEQRYKRDFQPCLLFYVLWQQGEKGGEVIDKTELDEG